MKPALRRQLRDLALVAAGAVPGALLRWRLQAVDGGGSSGTLLANLLGCLLLGLVLARPAGSGRLALAVGIGFCGSLTTFSTLMLQLTQALQAGRASAAGGLLLASLVGGVALVALGHALGTALLAAARRP